MKNLLEEMWAALAAYQPQADAAGHGATWAAMCKERTVAAARAAYAAAYAASYVAYAAAYAAAAAAADADAASYAASYVAEKWARVAIDYINKATLKEKNT